MRQEWVLVLTENDLAYLNVLTRVTPRTTNPCKSGLWDVLIIAYDSFHWRKYETPVSSPKSLQMRVH